MYRNGEDSERYRAPQEEPEEERNEEYREHRKIHWWLIILALVLAFLAVSYFLGWTNQWSKGLNEAFPGLNFDWINNPDYVDTGRILPETTSEPQPTQPVIVQPTEQVTVQPVETAKPTEAPANVETAAPTAAPTEAPVVHATYEPAGDIQVSVKGEYVTLRTFHYYGGYIAADDPWFSTIKKETEESYGPPIYGKTPQELAYNWLRELCKSPQQVIRLRTQMGMIEPKSLEEESSLARKLAKKKAKDYDAIVNETLDFFYNHMKDGTIQSSTDWGLENYMTYKKKDGLSLHGRTGGDDDTDPDKKDILLTFYPKGADKTFVSSKQGWENTLNDAKASKNSFSQRAWVNMTEGGTWKHKAKGGNPSPDPTPKPTNVVPTATPTGPAPTSTPEPTPTPTSRPTKDPSQAPTVSDAPVGGGSTDPDHATDPKTSSAPTSTPKPKKTPKPTNTPKPTAVPTAVVRPTEACETTVAPLIREDETTQPSGGQHNVPTAEPATGGGNNNGDFNPDDI